MTLCTQKSLKKNIHIDSLSIVSLSLLQQKTPKYLTFRYHDVIIISGDKLDSYILAGLMYLA